MYAKVAETQRAYQAADAAYANILQRNAFKLDFAPPLKAYETLQRLYYPLRFKGGVGIPTQHPVLAGHQRVAGAALQAFASRQASILEIGPSLHSAARLSHLRYHGCTKTGTRDQARHIAALHSTMVRGISPQFQADATLLAAGIPSETFCVDGVGACAFQAQLGISNHSLYDVELEELANAFNNHGLHMVKAFMHIPEELLYMDEVVNDELGYRFKVVDDDFRVRDTRFTSGDARVRAPRLQFLPEDQRHRIERLVSRGSYSRRFVIFSGNDDWADAYCHDYHRWLAYLLVRNYPTPFGFSLHIEVQRRHGSSVELRITRADGGDRIFAVIPRTSQGLCRVPNIFAIADDSGTEHKTILTSQHKVNMLLNFMQTRPEKELADFTVLMSFARARLRAIIVATEVAESSWHITPSDLVRVVASVYVIHLVERERIKFAVKAAKDDVFSDLSLWESFRNTLASCCGIRGGSRVFSADVTERYRVLSLTDIICDVQLTPEEVGWLPARISPARVYHDKEALSVLRDAGVYRAPEPSAPPLEPEATQDVGVWAAASAALPDYRACIAAGASRTDIKYLKITLENALKETEGLTLKPVKGLELYTGPPGSGKTRKLLAAVETAGTRMLFIAPTSELRAEMEKSIKPPSDAATQHNALSMLRRAVAAARPYELVVIDECFMLPLVYVSIVAAISPESKIVLVGDENQIGFIDFEGLMPGTPTVKDILRECAIHRYDKTHRSPADVVSTAFYQRLYPGVATTSSNTHSIEYVPASYVNSSAVTLCFTQEEKSRCASEGAATVAEVQGKTFASVILHYNGTAPEQQLIAADKHLLVGITRHTNHLYVRDHTGDIERKLAHSPKVELLMDQEMPLEMAAIKPNVEVHRAEPSAPIPPQRAVPAGAISILRSAFGDQPECGCVALARTGYECFGGRAKINVELAEPDQAPKPFRAFQEGVQWVKVTNASNKHQALQTLLARYTKRAKSLNPREAASDAKRMMDSMDKHWCWDVTADARERAVVDTLARFTQRGGRPEDLVDPDDPYIRDVDFLMKTQQKVSTKPMNSGKVGQGIAAHSKSLNFVLAVWVRILDEVLRTGSTTVRYSNGLPDEEEAMLLEAAVNKVPNASFKSADWTEFDTAHNNVSEIFFAELLTRVGTPEAAVALFRQRCGKRTLRAKGIGSVEVDGLLDSGAVWTLTRNTAFSAGVMLTLFRGIKFAAFKGDDSLLVGSGPLTFTPARLHMGEHYAKAHLKVETEVVVPYIGLLVSAEQVVSDPVRVALKVFGRCYSTHTLYEKYIAAVADLTTGWSDAANSQRIMYMAAAYYAIDVASIAYVMDAVRRFAYGDFAYETLTVVRAHVQAPDAYAAAYPHPASIRESVFEPRSLSAPTAGNVPAYQCVTVPSSTPSLKTGASAANLSHVATGSAPPTSTWVVPAASSCLDLSTPAIQCTSSSPSPSSSSPPTLSGASPSVGATAKSTDATSVRKTASQGKSSLPRCLERKGGATAPMSTAPRARAHSSSWPRPGVQPTTAPSASAAASPSATPSCATQLAAAPTTQTTAPTATTRSAPVAEAPYVPPTPAVQSRFRDWQPSRPRRRATEDVALAPIVAGLVKSRFTNKKSSSRSSGGCSAEQGQCALTGRVCGCVVNCYAPAGNVDHDD